LRWALSARRGRRKDVLHERLRVVLLQFVTAYLLFMINKVHVATAATEFVCAA
jgi:hypothetical protein